MIPMTSSSLKVYDGRANITETSNQQINGRVTSHPKKSFPYLPSLSIIVTLAVAGRIVMPSGESKKLRETTNISKGSETLSSVIGISAHSLLLLALNVS